MNVALPALLVFLVLLPGFAFRSRIKRVERTSFDFSPFGHVVTEGVSLAVVLHGVWLAAAYLVFDRVIDAGVLLSLLSSGAGSHDKAFQAVAREQMWVAGYFFSLLVFSFYGPTLIRLAIMHWKMDRAGSKLSPLVRFTEAPWYYLLTGADFAKGEEPDLILVSALVDTKSDEPLLYMGVLEEYFVDQDGTLDRLVLSDVLRRPLGTDRSDPADPSLDRFYSIEGDYFVLRYSEAITLNVRYVKLEPARVSANQEIAAFGQIASAAAESSKPDGDRAADSLRQNA